MGHVPDSTRKAAMTAGMLTHLDAGAVIPFGGDRFTTVPADLAAAFQPGDHLHVVQTTGALLHVPAAVRDAVEQQVDAAVAAFERLRAAERGPVHAFYVAFADALADDDVWSRRRRGERGGRRTCGVAGPVDDPPSRVRPYAAGHDRRTARLGGARPERAGERRRLPCRARRLGRRYRHGATRRDRVRVRGAPQRLRRCRRRARHGQHRRPAHRGRRARDGASHRRARAPPRAGELPHARRCRQPRPGPRTLGGMGALQRCAPGARRCARFRLGGDRVEQRRPAERHPRQLPRHRRRLADRRRHGGRSPSVRRRAQFPRSQGVQHPQRRRRGPRASRRVRPADSRRRRRGCRRSRRHRAGPCRQRERVVAAEHRLRPLDRGAARRGSGRRAPCDAARRRPARHRVGMGGHSRAEHRRRRGRRRGRTPLQRLQPAVRRGADLGGRGRPGRGSARP